MLGPNLSEGSEPLTRATNFEIIGYRSDPMQKKAMGTANTKTLWGCQFRLASQGLDETDVVKFVEGLVGRYISGLEQVGHASSLHDLAANTVRQAERMAEEIKQEAHEASRQETDRLIAEAQRQAISFSERLTAEIIRAAQARAEEIVAASQRDAEERLAAFEDALRAEMQTRGGQRAAIAPTAVSSLRPEASTA